jgi:hypothetical protein
MTMTDRAADEDVVDYLLRIDNSTFQSIVNDEMRSTVDKPRVDSLIAAGLRDPQVLRRWYSTILSMHKSVEGQFSAKTADNTAMIKRLQLAHVPRTKILSEQASFETWRAGALRVKNGLEIRLIEAKSLLEQLGDPYITDRTSEERNLALARVGALEDAIRRHRFACLSQAMDDPRDADEALWSYLPEVE